MIKQLEFNPRHRDILDALSPAAADILETISARNCALLYLGEQMAKALREELSTLRGPNDVAACARALRHWDELTRKINKS